MAGNTNAIPCGKRHPVALRWGFINSYTRPLTFVLLAPNPVMATAVKYESVEIKIVIRDFRLVDIVGNGSNEADGSKERERREGKSTILLFQRSYYQLSSHS